MKCGELKMRIGEILACPSSDGEVRGILELVSKELKRLNLKHTFKDDNLYVEKGSGNRICLLVSLEGTREKEDNFKVCKLPKSRSWIAYNKYGRQISIGGTKIGIYLALKLLEKLPNIKVVFTLEKYGKGKINCYSAIYRLDKKFFDDIQCILSLDGDGDKNVSYQASSFGMASDDLMRRIEPVIKRYDFKIVDASYNSMGVCIKDFDVKPSTLVLGVGIKETDSEFEFISEKGATSAVVFILDMLRSIGNEMFPFDSYE